MRRWRRQSAVRRREQQRILGFAGHRGFGRLHRKPVDRQHLLAGAAGCGSQTKEQFNIGSREVYIAALKDGSIDLVPEYTGALLSYLDPKSTAATTEAVTTELKSKLPSGISMLTPSAAEDKDAVASAHSPRRMCISAWLMPKALIAITTSPSRRSRLGNLGVDQTVQTAELFEHDGPHQWPTGLFSDHGGRSGQRRSGAGRMVFRSGATRINHRLSLDVVTRTHQAQLGCMTQYNRVKLVTGQRTVTVSVLCIGAGMRGEVCA